MLQSVWDLKISIYAVCISVFKYYSLQKLLLSLFFFALSSVDFAVFAIVDGFQLIDEVHLNCHSFYAYFWISVCINRQ